MKFLVEQLITDNILIETFQTELGLSFFESLKLSKDIEKIFKELKLKVPKEIEGIKEIDITDKKNLVKIITDRGKKEETKIGKLFIKLFPNLKDFEISRLSELYYAKYEQGNKESSVKFEVYNDVSKWYDKLAKCGTSSCMAGEKETKTHLLKFYDNIKDVSIVIMFENNNPVGRALLWSNVKGCGKKFLDRTYPAGDLRINDLYHQYAKKNGWDYRKQQGYGDYRSATCGNMEYTVKNFNFKQEIPYLDTFRFGTVEGKDLVLNNASGQHVFDQTDGYNVQANDLTILRSPLDYFCANVLAGNIYHDDLHGVMTVHSFDNDKSIPVKWDTFKNRFYKLYKKDFFDYLYKIDDGTYNDFIDFVVEYIKNNGIKDLENSEPKFKKDVISVLLEKMLISIINDKLPNYDIFKIIIPIIKKYITKKHVEKFFTNLVIIALEYASPGYLNILYDIIRKFNVNIKIDYKVVPHDKFILSDLPTSMLAKALEILVFDNVATLRNLGPLVRAEQLSFPTLLVNPKRILDYHKIKDREGKYFKLKRGV